MPHPLVLIYILVIAAVIMTWIIPAGQFAVETKTLEGETVTVTVPGTYQRIAARPAGPQALLLSPIQGFRDGVRIIVFLFVIGGAFAIIQSTGAIDLAIRRLAAAFSRHPRARLLVIPVLMTVFSLGGAIFGMSEEVIPFITIFIPLALSLGYDSIVGVAIPFLGAAAGFAAAFFNPFTVGIAQGLAGLPLYSGLGYRLLIWGLGTAISIAFVMFYAAKVHRRPETSPVYELDRERTAAAPAGGPDADTWTWNHQLILWLFLAGMIGLVAGILIEKWLYEEIAALFLALGLISGFIGRKTASEMARDFTLGAKDMVGVALVIACSRAILVVARDGRSLDTVLYWVSGFISVFPKVVTAQIMFLTQCGINFFIHSGTAQASMTMPVMTPLSDLVGITRQTAVLAFQLCEFIIPVLPTSAVTMGILGVARIPFEKWARWCLPLMLMLMALSLLLLIPPVLVHWGPL